MKLTTSQRQAKINLYLGLAKDAMATSKREKSYAEMAWRERKYSKKDKAIACKKNQPARESDDTFELHIDAEFYKYRMGVSKHFSKVSKMYTAMAEKEREKL